MGGVNCGEASILTLLVGVLGFVNCGNNSGDFVMGSDSFVKSGYNSGVLLLVFFAKCEGGVSCGKASILWLAPSPGSADTLLLPRLESDSLLICLRRGGTCGSAATFSSLLDLSGDGLKSLP